MRIFRLVATPILLLGLLGLLLWGAYWGWQNLTAPLPTPAPTPCVTVNAKTVTPANLTVRVFNGGFTSGLAYRISTQLKDAGMRVIKTDNTDERIKGTVIRANKSSQAQIELLTSYFKKVILQNDDRIDGTIDVLVGTDWEGMGDKPLKEVAPKAGQSVCVAATASPTPTGTTSPAPSGQPTG